MFSAGARASSKNTSLNSMLPVICWSGRTSMPGASIGTSRYEMPACLLAPGSVRNSPNM